MKTISLHGMLYRAHSPSRFELLLEGFNQAPAAIVYSGWCWLVAIHGIFGTKEFASRDEAALLIADAFKFFAWENLG